MVSSGMAEEEDEWEEEEEEEEEGEGDEDEVPAGVPQAAVVVIFLSRMAELLRRRRGWLRRLEPLRPPPIEEIPFEEFRRRREVRAGYRCPYCGGSVDTLSGRCQVCGERVS